MESLLAAAAAASRDGNAAAKSVFRGEGAPILIVIPGRAEGADPESRQALMLRWIPGSRCARPGMTGVIHRPHCLIGPGQAAFPSLHSIAFE